VEERPVFPHISVVLRKQESMAGRQGQVGEVRRAAVGEMSDGERRKEISLIGQVSASNVPTTGAVFG
jgi:hypothetical protein